MKALRIAGIVLAAIVLLVVAAGRYYLAPEPIPEHSDFTIDPDQLARMARSIPGPLPLRVNHHLIATSAMPRAALFSGWDFGPHEMVHGVYQIVYPDGGYILVDAGFGRAIFDQMSMGGESDHYDDAAFAQLARAMPGARTIVITHEHLDHIQGLAEVEDPAALAERLYMPAPQHANPDTRDLLPAALLDRVEPVEAAGIRPLAPGVVVQPAAGHTPGSQLVYVRTRDGHAFLLIGDVAWDMDQIIRLEYRPRLVTDLMLGEDRAAVMAQLRTLHELLDDGRLQIVSSHDSDQLEALQAEGLIGKGLELPAPLAYAPGVPAAAAAPATWGP